MKNNKVNGLIMGFTSFVTLFNVQDKMKFSQFVFLFFNLRDSLCSCMRNGSFR